MARISRAFFSCFVIISAVLHYANCRVNDTECPYDDIESRSIVVDECPENDTCVRFCKETPCESFNLTMKESARHLNEGFKVLIGMKCKEWHECMDEWSFSKVQPE